MSMRFKRLVGLGAAVACLLSGGQATAQLGNLGLCGDWEVGAHALYFTPITCPYAYANVFTSTDINTLSLQEGQAQIISCRPDWGFRVFGNYLDDCLFVGVSYQWFNITTTRSTVAIAPASLTIRGGGSSGPGKATGQVGIEYQNIDVKLGKHLLQGCGSSLYIYGNARWVALSHRRATRVFFSNNAFQDAREKSQLNGGALGLGLGAQSDVWCNVGAFLDGNILGVVGKRSLKNIRFRNLNFGNLSDAREAYPSETCVIPEVDFRIGINYTYACGCWTLIGEIGYEVDYFWHGSVFPEIVSGQGANNRKFAPVCTDLGFSGLFFGGRLTF